QDPLKEQRVPRRPAGLLADRTLSPALLPSLTHTPPPVILHVPCRPSTPRPVSARSPAFRSSTLCHPPFITPRSSTWGLTSCTWRSTWKTWRAPCAPSARSPAFAGSASRSPTRSPSSGISTRSNPPPGASAPSTPSWRTAASSPAITPTRRGPWPPHPQPAGLEPLHAGRHEPERRGDLCPRFAADSPPDGHGHRLQPPGDALAEGGQPGRLPHHTRPGDVPAAGRGAVRTLDPAAGSGRGHARRAGRISPGRGASHGTGAWLGRLGAGGCDDAWGRRVSTGRGASWRA